MGKVNSINNQRLFIGGEYAIDPACVCTMASSNMFYQKANPQWESLFTRGGYHSLLFVIKYLIPKDSIVLLPSYLCESILIPFRLLKCPYVFYRVDKDLRIDGDDLCALLIKYKEAPVLVIDYFGFQPNFEIQNLLEKEKNTGRIIIQDRSQSSLSCFPNYGSISFNSFRKIGPADGSKLEYEKKLLAEGLTRMRKRFLDRSALYKTIGQVMRHYHIEKGVFPAKWFIKMFAKAEMVYYNNTTDIKNMLGFHDHLFRTLEPEIMINRRRENYRMLFNKYSSLSLMPKTLSGGETPLFFAIKHTSRDDIRKRLMSEGIFTSVHWTMPKELIGNNKYQDSYELSRRELSIPVDHRIGLEDMTILVTKLGKIL